MDFFDDFPVKGTSVGDSRTGTAVAQFVHNKDEIKRDMQSNIVYQLNCSSCQTTYIGKKIRQLHRRLREHGARQPSISTPSEDFRRSASIAAKSNKIHLDLNFNSSDERNGDITMSTERETHRSTKIKSAIEWHVHVGTHQRQLTGYQCH